LEREIRLIQSFKDPEAELVFNNEISKKLPQDIQRVALRKLRYLHGVNNLQDLAAIPGHRLEKLHGDREGQWSIRINDQWRVCFHWQEGPSEVEIVDYH
jgi:proteic killer suppression protein